MVPHNWKKPLSHLAPHSPSAFGFHENGDPPHDSPFFLHWEYENRIEKSCFYQEILFFSCFYRIFLFLEIVYRFSIFTKKRKNADVSKIKENLGTNWDIISKAPMVHYCCTKFHVSSKFLSRDMARGKSDPLPPGHTQIISSMGLIGFTKISEFCFIGWDIQFSQGKQVK